MGLNEILLSHHFGSDTIPNILSHFLHESKYAVPLGTAIASVLHPFVVISNSQFGHFAMLFLVN